MQIDITKWKFGFTLSCNEFFPFHMNVEEAVEEINELRPKTIDYDTKERILETGELWSFDGNPKNSVGSYSFYAGSWPELLSYIKEVELDATS